MGTLRAPVTPSSQTQAHWPHWDAIPGPHRSKITRSWQMFVSNVFVPRAHKINVPFRLGGPHAQHQEGPGKADCIASKVRTGENPLHLPGSGRLPESPRGSRPSWPLRLLLLQVSYTPRPGKDDSMTVSHGTQGPTVILSHGEDPSQGPGALPSLGERLGEMRHPSSPSQHLLL